MQSQLELEKGLVSIWLNNQMTRYVETFNEEDFNYFKGTYKKIKKLVQDKKDISLIAVSGEYKTHELAQILSEAIPSQIEVLVEQMQMLIAEKKLNSILKNETQGNPYEKASSLIEKLREITPIAEPMNLDEHLSALLAEISERQNKVRKYSYGLPKLDKKTNGLHEGNLIIISGRPGSGKTALAMQTTRSNLIRKHKVLYVSLEMSEPELLERMVMLEEEFNTDRMKNGTLTKQECDKLSMTIDHIREYPIVISTKVRDMSQLRIEIAKENPEIVVLDQISLIRDSERHNSKREEFSAITRKLKLMAMDFNIPIIALAQINRDAQETIPTLANLKESGSIEEDANCVIMVHTLTEEQNEKLKVPKPKKDNQINVFIMLAKNRAGETINIGATFEGGRYRFEEIIK